MSPFPSRLLAASLSLALGACVSLPRPPPSRDAGRPEPVGVAEDMPPATMLQPGDRVRVVIRGEPDLVIDDAALDARGALHLPGSGDVELRGLPLPQAQARLEHAARRGDRLAEVELQLREPLGQRATVLGAVVAQGSIAVTPRMRISQLVSASGGLLSAPNPTTGAPVSLADLSAAVLTRQGRPLPIDLDRAMRGDPRHDVYVHPGDHLYIPHREHGAVSVFGQVGSPGVFVHWPGLRMTEALALAGGLTTDADKRDIRVLRGPAHRPLAYQADLMAVADGEAADPALQPGDVLFVTDHPLEDFREALSVLVPFFGASTATLLVVLTALAL